MKKNRFLMMVAIGIVIITLLPLVRHYVFGLEMRQTPGAVQAEQELSQPEEIATPEPTAAPTPEPAPASGLVFESEYGYYPEDQWVEGQCGFYVTAENSGEIVLSIYYPYAITGDQTGHVFLDGQHCTDFTIAADNFEVRVPCQAGQRHYVQINSDFALAPGEDDQRALAFVLLNVTVEPDEAEA